MVRREGGRKKAEREMVGCWIVRGGPAWMPSSLFNGAAQDREKAP